MLVSISNAQKARLEGKNSPPPRKGKVPLQFFYCKRVKKLIVLET